MPTRAAAKREAEFLKESLASANVKRKRAPSKGKLAAEPVTGGWDVLPHGLGKKDDLLQDVANQKHLTKGVAPPPTKRTRRSKAVSNDQDTTGTEVKTQDQDSIPAVQKKRIQRNSTNAEKSSIPEVTQSRVKKPGYSTAESRSPSQIADPVTAELLDDDALLKISRKSTLVKTENDTVKDEELQDVKPRKTHGSQNKTKIDTSEDVLKKASDLISVTGKVPTIQRKKKNKYGLSPGVSPFPDHVKPTPADCEEVTRLLSELHGAVKAPEVIPPPSMEVAGCGEVPDLLDALIRTLLSASTTANNANMSLKGLKDKFGLRTSGVGKGSVNWEAVHRADLPTVIDAIKQGGLAKVKGAYIKGILDTVHQENCTRRDALLKEKETGEPANIPGAKHETEDQKETEILNANESLLSMDHIFEMSTEEAMEEMTKLPGIGVKTASCVILFCMKRPSFAVDTHVWRHCKWLGWVPEKANRDQTFSHCEVRIPDHLKYPLHQLFLRHGKTCGRCRANTSTGNKEWNDTVCPIEHLVNRTEAKKQPGYSTAKKTPAIGGKKGARGKKGKISDEETEESDVQMEDLNGEDDDE